MSLHKTMVPGSFCTNFYYCFQNKLKKLICPINLLFDENRKMCNYAHKVSCSEIILLLKSNTTTLDSLTSSIYSTKTFNESLNQTTEDYQSSNFELLTTANTNEPSTNEDIKIFEITVLNEGLVNSSFLLSQNNSKTTRIENIEFKNSTKTTNSIINNTIENTTKNLITEKYIKTESFENITMFDKTLDSEFNHTEILNNSYVSYTTSVPVSIKDNATKFLNDSFQNEMISTQELISSLVNNFTHYDNNTDTTESTEYDLTSDYSRISITSLLLNYFNTTDSYQNTSTSSYYNYNITSTASHLTNQYEFISESNSTNTNEIKLTNFTSPYLLNFTITDLNDSLNENYFNFSTSKYNNTSNSSSYTTFDNETIISSNSNKSTTVETFEFTSIKEIDNITNQFETTTIITHNEISTTEISDSIIVDLVINGILPNDYEIEKLSSSTETSYSTTESLLSEEYNNSTSFMFTTTILINKTSTAINSHNNSESSEYDSDEMIEIEAYNISESKLHELLNISDLTSFRLNASELEISIDINSDSSENKSEILGSTTVLQSTTTHTTMLQKERNITSTNSSAENFNNSTKSNSNSMNLTEIELNINDIPQPLSNFNNISGLISSLFSFNNSNITTSMIYQTTENFEFEIDSNFKNKTKTSNYSEDDIRSTSTNVNTVMTTTSNNLIIESNNSTHYIIDWCEFVNLGLVPSCQNGNFVFIFNPKFYFY